MTRGPARVIVAAVFGLLALALQTTVLSRLPLPGGRPDLLLVVVVAAALTGGVPVGIGVGFSIGLAADLLSSHPAGVLALLFLLVGAATGHIESERERSVFWSMLVVAIASVSAGIGYALLSSVVSGGGSWQQEIAGLPMAVLYNSMLTPFVVPLTAAIERASRSTAMVRL